MKPSMVAISTVYDCDLIVSTIEKDVCLLLHLAKVEPTSTTSETTTEKKPTKAKGPQGEEGGGGKMRL